MPKNGTYERLAAVVAHRPGGWGRPSGDTKAHLYDAGVMLSVCGRSLYFGATTDTPGNIRRCPTCWRIELERTTP